MALHVIVESDPTGSRRWRAEVDPETGWTRLCDGLRTIATAWFCPPARWSQVEPPTAAVCAAFARVATTLERLGFSPMTPHGGCAGEGPCGEAI